MVRRVFPFCNNSQPFRLSTRIAPSISIWLCLKLLLAVIPSFSSAHPLNSPLLRDKTFAWQDLQGRTNFSNNGSRVPMGFMFDPCFSTLDCKGDLLCVTITFDAICERSDEFCLCLSGAPDFCDGCKPCPSSPHEICGISPYANNINSPLEDEHENLGGICISSYVMQVEKAVVEKECPAAIPTAQAEVGTETQTDTQTEGEAEGEEETEKETETETETEMLATPTTEVETEVKEVCIDAKALEGRPSVYGRHRQAAVLCDEEGSCATPGHLVIFKDRAMIMRQYCTDANACERRVILVNSPRYGRGMKIPSKTAHLHYSAFAARYDTRLERALLKLLVKLGL